MEFSVGRLGFILCDKSNFGSYLVINGPENAGFQVSDVV